MSQAKSGGAVGLVVPVFDETARAAEYVGRLADFVSSLPAGSELLFVDDGSSDGTADVIERLLAARRGSGRVLRRPHEGKGAAVAAGLRALSTPLRAFCDLDLSTPPDDLRRILRAGARAEVLAIGSRDVIGAHLLRPQTPWREAMGRAYNRLLQLTVAPGVVDTQCGAKAARAEVWETILEHCSEGGFAWDAEAVAVALARGVEVAEIPVTWSNDPRSKVRLGRDGAAMVLATRRVWLSRRRAAEARAPSDRAGEMFGATNARRLVDADRTHWWFRSKAALVATALRRTRSVGHRGRWLVDAGAGAGGVSALLGWDAERLVVLDGNAELVRHAARSHGLTAVRSEVGALPLRPAGSSVICLLDVIEHLEDPVHALRQAAEALAPGGRLVVNVPAHRWLWSAADVELGHQRRYTRSLLRTHLATAGLEPLLVTHVFSWLVLPVWAARRLRRGEDAELGLERTGPLIDAVSVVLTWLERQLVGRIGLPLGTSILAVAVKPPRGTPLPR